MKNKTDTREAGSEMLSAEDLDAVSGGSVFLIDPNSTSQRKVVTPLTPGSAEAGLFDPELAGSEEALAFLQKLNGNQM